MATRLRIDASRRTTRTAQAIGESYRHQREDAGLTQRQVAQTAGISQPHYAAIEAGGVVATLEVLQSIALALGGDVSLKFYPGTGPRIRDRLLAPMVEAILRILHPRWQRFPEVPVHRPAAGVIDLVLADPSLFLLVAAEFQSELRRLEQQLRWAALKAEGLPATSIAQLVGTAQSKVDRLLVLRSTRATRVLARDYGKTLRAAYPARMADVLASLTGDAPWPGSGVVWITLDRRGAHVMDRRPPGVVLGA